MKVRTSIKKMCAGCHIVRYNRKNYVKCNENPRHKQRQRFSTVSPLHTYPLPTVPLSQQPVIRQPIKDVMSLIIWKCNNTFCAYGIKSELLWY